MRYLKRILGIVMSIALMFSCVVPANAAATTLEDAEVYANALNHLGLFLGTNNGYELEADLTREQAITMVVRLLGKEAEAKEKNYAHPFKDVPEWADAYVGYAYEMQITKGVAADSFGAGQPVTEAQFLTFLLRLLSYEEGVEFTWDEPYELAAQSGLYQEVATEETGFIRGGAVVLSWQFLNQKAKGSETTVAEELIEKNVFADTAFDEATLISEGKEYQEPVKPNTPDKDDENNETEDVPVQPEQPTPEQPEPEQPTPEQPEPEQPTPEQPEPEQPTPEQPEPEQPTPEQPEPEQPTPEQPEPEQPTPEQPEPEQPGGDNSGDNETEDLPLGPGGGNSENNETEEVPFG